MRSFCAPTCALHWLWRRKIDGPGMRPTRKLRSRLTRIETHAPPLPLRRPPDPVSGACATGQWLESWRQVKHGLAIQIETFQVASEKNEVASISWQSITENAATSCEEFHSSRFLLGHASTMLVWRSFRNSQPDVSLIVGRGHWAIRHGYAPQRLAEEVAPHAFESLLAPVGGGGW